ncbi:MAG: TraB/GumN family protein [Bacteroidetes bacterium]|nr:TraB/GumN family protein [Bacteroidota bacterium]
MPKKPETVFILLILFASIILTSNKLAAQSGLPKKYQSLLWEISGNGMKKPSYLYGTMHVSNKLAFNLTDSFFVAIKSCEAVALELNMDVWMDDIMKMKDANTFKNTTNYIYNHYGFYKGAFALDIPKEKDLKGLLQFSPSISNNLLYRNNRYESDYEEDNYLDVFIFQSGKKLNKKIFGLENFRTTEEFLNRAEAEGADQVADDKTKEDENEQSRLRLKQLTNDKSYNETLEDAYRKGDLDLLDTLNKLSSEPLFIKYMINERNKIMAHRMDSIMKRMPLFTGVGASHLPGNDGVLELLRRMGYTVRPVISSKYDTKTKTTIDETRFPVQLKTQYSNDSIFSVSIPGKLYEIYDKGSYKYYLNNDMGNGSYYCIQRMNHYGSLTNEKPEYILKKIDSLIFENIPGKLLTKKEIKNSAGYPGIEVTNKTRTGDIQKCQLFISANEIFVFKMSGSQEYVNKGTEAETFFSSITFHEKPSTIVNFKSSLGYSVSMPLNKILYSNNGQTSYQQEIVTANNTTDGKFSMVMMASLYDYDYIEEDTFELNMLSERFCRQANYKILSKKITKENGNPALEIMAKEENKPENKLMAQVIISGPDYYLMVSNNDSIKTKEFFDSFKIIEKKSTVPYTTISDTSLFFNVSTQSKSNDYNSLVTQKSKLESTRYNKKDKTSKKDEMFLPKRETIVYTSPETGEQVYVEFRKFSMFFQQETMDAFWKSRIKGLSEESGMNASRIVKTKKDPFSEVDLLLTDTNSTRGICVKFIQRCGSLYTLKSFVDTVSGMSIYSKTFFDSFVPKDTCIGLDVTSNKLDTYFFSKLYSTDTTVSKQTKTAIEYVQGNMLASNIPSLIKTIESKEFDKLSTSDKKELISCFRSLKSKETLPFLATTYLRFSDSVELELAVLKAVARLRSNEASQTFLKLMNADLPVTSSDIAISSVFNTLDDSLPTSVGLYPEILKYTKYPEYKVYIYKLMVMLKEKDLIKPKSYKKQLDGILLDGMYELKKYISDKDRDKEPYRYSSNKSKSLYEDLNYRQQKVYGYATLLAPFNKDKDVKLFFDKLLKSTNSDKFKVMVYGTLVKNNFPIADTILKNYASNVSTRVTLYQVLDEQNKLNLFDKQFGTQKDLVISQLFGSEDNFKKDTVVLLSKIQTECDKTKGNLYVFKIRPKEKKVWKLYCSALHPMDEKQVNLYPAFTKTNVAFDNDIQSQKQIDTLMQKLRIENRKRANINDFETSSGYNDYLDY